MLLLPPLSALTFLSLFSLLTLFAFWIQYIRCSDLSPKERVCYWCLFCIYMCLRVTMWQSSSSFSWCGTEYDKGKGKQRNISLRHDTFIIPPTSQKLIFFLLFLSIFCVFLLHFPSLTTSILHKNEHHRYDDYCVFLRFPQVFSLVRKETYCAITIFYMT